MLFSPQPCQSPLLLSLSLRPLQPVWPWLGTPGTQNQSLTTWSSTNPNPQTTASWKCRVWQPLGTASAASVPFPSTNSGSWQSTTSDGDLLAMLWKPAPANKHRPRHLYTSKRVCWVRAQCWFTGSHPRSPTGRSGATGSTTAQTLRLHWAPGRSTTQMTAASPPYLAWCLTSPTALGCWASPLLATAHPQMFCKSKPSLEVTTNII